MRKMMNYEKVWIDNETFFRDILLQVPRSFLLELLAMSNLTDKEFAYLLKIEEDLPKIKIVDWYLPKQKNDSGSVLICERLNGYDGVIHRHPNGLEKFSNIDWEYLNKNYKLSLIYCDGRITDMAYKVKVGDKYTWIRSFDIDIIEDVDITSKFVN